MRNGSFTVKDLRLYDETSSSKGRSPAAHTAQNVAFQLPPSASLPKRNYDSKLATLGSESERMSEKCLRDPLGGAHECLITIQTTR